MADAVANLPPDIVVRRSRRAAGFWSSTTSRTSAKAWKRCSPAKAISVELAANATEGLKRLEASLLRSGAARPDDAGQERHAGARGSPRARSRNADLHDHRVRLGGGRRGGAEARRQRLFLQALGQRKAADRDRPHDLEAPAGAREHELKRALQAALQLSQHRRQERAHAEDAGSGGAGGAEPLHHPDHRRNRNRQGADRQRDSRQFGARRASVRAGAFGLGAAGSAGIRAVRPREGRLHRRDGVAQGLFRNRQPRHHFLRRDRHHFRWRRRPSCCA